MSEYTMRELVALGWFLMLASVFLVIAGFGAGSNWVGALGIVLFIIGSALAGLRYILRGRGRGPER